MTEHPPHPHSPPAHPEREPQLTARAVVAGMVLGGFLSLSNLYVALKTGWSIGVSITAGILAYAISEHVENAGIHSGDATLVFPAQKLYLETVRRIKSCTRQIAKALNISGPFNIQYIAKDNQIKVIECNLRVSRSFPFVSKVSGVDFIGIAAKALLGLPVENIRDGYGMAEHCAPYLECRRHRFHVPVYCRVYARDPVTLEVLRPGRPGLLELVTPWNAMMPNLAILSTDLGVVSPQRCPCGYNSPTFTLQGRGGLTKHKGCAIHAGEIVRRAS